MADKPKLRNQKEADVVQTLKALGCTVDTALPTDALFLSNMMRFAHFSRICLGLTKRFRMTRGEYGIELNQALFDAYDDWVQTHQED